MSRLDGKIAIVTGSASGIGRQIALRFARKGAKVAVADLNLGAAQEVAGEIARGGSTAIAVAMDVADEAQVAGRSRRGRHPTRRGRHPGQQRRHPVHRAAGRPPARRLAEGPGRAPRRGLPDDPGLPAAHDPAGPRRYRALHRLGPLRRGIAPEGPLRRGQARPDGAGPAGRQGGGRARRPGQRDLPRLRPHAPGRSADPRAGQGIGPDRGRGRQEGHAAGDGRRRSSRRRGTSRRWPSSSRPSHHSP